jgi:5S rRNA maturation endonuclease (ribonuclease M5)
LSLSTGAEQKLKTLTRLLDHFSQEAQRGIPIIVEGRKDLYALAKLNIVGNVLCIKNSCRSLSNLLDTVQSKSVIVFVDFDKEGRTLVKMISTYLERVGIKVNLKYWRRIKALLKRDVKDVEGIPSYLEKLKKQGYPFS